jgi:hypothetical protein
MTSSKTKKRQTLLLKSSILTIAAAVMFSLFAAPLISQQSVMPQIGPSPESNNMSSSSANMSTTTTSVGGAPGSVFKLSRASIPIDIPLIEGFVNGNPVFYINTDISDQKLASQLTSTTGFRVNYAPLLAQAPNDGVAEFYVFKNGIKGTGTLGFQPTVGNAQPGDAKYSPLWKINIVEWKNGITPKV